MTKFILLYNGPATPPEQMSKEQMEKVGAGWKTWMEKVGHALVDFGLPMAPNGRSIVDDGSSGTVPALNGYTILQAEDMDAAVKLVEDHPFLSDKTGKFSVDVYELLPMPNM